MTVNCGTAESPSNVNGVAPFSYVANAKANPDDENDSPAAIRNLNVVANINTSATHAGALVGRMWGTLNIDSCTVSGTIQTSAKYACGYIGEQNGSANITGCVSSVTIKSSVNGDGTHGGFVGRTVGTSCNLRIEGCLFNGKLLTTNGTIKCGGFVGWNAGTLSITNSLYAPTDDPNTVTTDCATFARNWTMPSDANCYYTATLGTTQQCYDYTELTSGGAQTLVGGWYYVSGTVDITGTVTLGGDVTLILADGATLNIGTEDAPISSGRCIYGDNDGWSGKYSLTLYGQTAQSGALNAYNSTTYAVYLKNYTQHGGNVTIETTANREALMLGSGDLTLTRGSLTATGNDAISLDEGHTATVSGGTLNATGPANAIWEEWELRLPRRRPPADYRHRHPRSLRRHRPPPLHPRSELPTLNPQRSIPHPRRLPPPPQRPKPEDSD